MSDLNALKLLKCHFVKDFVQMLQHVQVEIVVHGTVKFHLLESWLLRYLIDLTLVDLHQVDQQLVLLLLVVKGLLRLEKVVDEIDLEFALFDLELLEDGRIERLDLFEELLLLVSGQMTECEEDVGELSFVGL